MALQGERLKTLRNQRGFTQEELAMRVGISLRLLQKYEKGDSDPSVDNVSKLAQALDTTTDYLAGITDEPASRVVEDNLSKLERLVLTLLRRGDKLGAISAISDQAGRESS